MKVLVLKDGEAAEVNNSYGMRLIEQGKAVLAPKSANKPDKKGTAKAGDA